MAKMFATDPEQKPLLMRGRFLSPRQRRGVTGVTDDTDDTDDTDAIGVIDDWWQSDDLLSLSPLTACFLPNILSCQLGLLII